MTDIHDRTEQQESAAADARMERFDDAVAALGHRSSAGDRRWALLGLVAMAAGIVIAVVAYISSTSQSDSRDVMSSGILASVGLAVVIAGAAVFVRSSLTEFLRFWILRVLLARDDEEDARR